MFYSQFLFILSELTVSGHYEANVFKKKKTVPKRFCKRHSPPSPLEKLLCSNYVMLILLSRSV